MVSEFLVFFSFRIASLETLVEIDFRHHMWICEGVPPFDLCRHGIEHSPNSAKHCM